MLGGGGMVPVCVWEGVRERGNEEQNSPEGGPLD